MDLIFNMQNPQLLNWSLLVEEIFQVHGQNLWPVANLPFVDFRYQPHCNYQSHWIRNFRFFFSYFGLFSLLEKFERHFLKAIRIFQCSSSHNPKRFRQTTLDWEWWWLCRSFINLSEWRESSWLPISNTRGKISHFFTCVVTDFLRAGNPCIIR